jgi:hypothetical protein
MSSPPDTLDSPALPWWHRALAVTGAELIYLLIRVFGRVTTFEADPWLRGPLGSDRIGDRPYEEVARQEGLTLTRDVRQGGLLESMAALDGPGFESATVHPKVRDFYEQTGAYGMDVWARTWFPANVALWLLVKVLSRKVDQLNFPTDALETSQGITSEIITLADPAGQVRYRGWFRRFARSLRVVYTGFYMVERVPLCNRPCVKVVFPMPRGNATVILAPSVDAEGRLELDSRGRGFGDVGFYRIQAGGDGRLRAWRVRSLVEHFVVYVDPDGSLRCDHRVGFLGLPVLQLHYRLNRAPGSADG